MISALNLENSWILLVLREQPSYKGRHCLQVCQLLCGVTDSRNLLYFDIHTSWHRLIVCVVMCIPLENCKWSCLFAFTDGIYFACALRYHGSIKLNFTLFLSYLFPGYFIFSTLSFSVWKGCFLFAEFKPVALAHLADDRDCEIVS